ncbi:ABC transporter ATP-binding protein [Patulibacter sp. NPDC049589]|uniref:ABC transporter ATP-binding protein n=1 Tax=Patulibacter sp. NPDC049589 TaxID=3154731 RepID=UPI003445F481
MAFGHGRAATEVVHGLDLDLRRGECLALVGASGSGKSATARALLGLAGPTATVTAERLLVAGHDAAALDERAWRDVRGREVGLVLQDALSSLDPLRTVGAEVAEPLRVHTRLDRASTDRRVLEQLAAVGIPDPERRVDQHPHELSGGLRQRALIATALIADPPLLIADEPTTALDVTVQRQILDLLERLKSEGRGLLLVSHDLAVVARIADRIAVMDDGRIVEHGPADRVLRAPEHAVTRALLEAVPRGRRATARGAAAERGTAGGGTDTTSPSASVGVPLVRVSGVTKRYRERGGRTRDALAGVSVDLDAGETLGIVGESGSGKSTLARVVLGVLQPDDGTVELRGGPWSALTDRRRRDQRRTFGLVPQDPLAALDPRHTVRQVLNESRGGVRLRRRDHDEELARLLAEVGLGAEHLDRRPAELSGGQRQRVAIARALAGDPAVLVCDEPVSALDVRAQARILALLTTVQRARSLAVLLVSHDLAVVREVCDRVAVVRDGLIVEHGPVEAIFTAPQHPYTRALLAATPRLPGDEDEAEIAPVPTEEPTTGARR